MNILIAEDDPSSRMLLQVTLSKWGHKIISTCDGAEAWDVLQQDNVPPLAILDWMMPGLDGIEICRRVRDRDQISGMYLIVLTAKTSQENIVQGLEAGADDYMMKPFNREELRARVNAGIRIVNLQNDLAVKVQKLEDALSKVHQLQGLLPICSYCKKIRDDKNYWQQVESFIISRTEARFSHSVCPDCYIAEVEPQLRKLKEQKKQNS
jgi:sigma-B regulation protein RsbU (phosphoserine phosphatase)